MRFFALPVVFAIPASAGNCCYSNWGGPCSGYAGSGGLCGSDFTTPCYSDSDCSDPAPAPPSPSPPTPSPTPSPPAPPAGPPYKGFWFGYAGSSAADPAPSSGWFFSFPGQAVEPPFNASEWGPILAPPAWGTYDKMFLTQGGGYTIWGDSFYSTLKDQISEYKSAGWDGVCWDWEQTSSDHTSAGFNALMCAAKDAGLINIVTSTAEGPYEWQAASADARDIDWSCVDYFVPQIYGAEGTLPDGWEEYVQYWLDGAGKPNVHNVTFGPIPMDKFLWGMPAGQCDLVESFGGSGCVEWSYSPNVKPPSALV